MVYKIIGLLLVVTFVVANSRVMNPAAELNGEGIFKSLETVEEIKSRARRSPDSEDVLETVKHSLSDTAHSVSQGVSTFIKDVKTSDTYESVKSGLNNLGERVNDQFKKIGSHIQRKIEEKTDD